MSVALHACPKRPQLTDKSRRASQWLTLAAFQQGDLCHQGTEPYRNTVSSCLSPGLPLPMLFCQLLLEVDSKHHVHYVAAYKGPY